MEQQVDNEKMRSGASSFSPEDTLSPPRHTGGLSPITNSDASVISPAQNVIPAPAAFLDTDGVFSTRLARVPRLFRYDNAHHQPEATGLALDIFARATILMSSIFLGPALLELATDALEHACRDTYPPETEQEQLDACVEDGRIFGFYPSSLLSNIAIVSGLLSSVAMPLFGAIVDHTSNRWNVGAWSAIGLVFVKGMETIVSSTTWFFVASLQVLSAILFNMHITTTLAYTSELSTDHVQQTGYNTYFVIVMYVATLLFLVFVTVMSFAFSLGDVGTARVSQITTTATSSIFFSVAWKYFFRERPALSTIPSGQSLASVGFRKNYDTFRRIARELPRLKYLTIAIMFGESATSTLITIATTFMKTFLEMNANEIGVVFLAVLLMGAPGSKLGGVIALRLNSVLSAAICSCILSVNTALASLTLTGPEHKKYMPLFGAIWGLGLGWQLPMNSTSFINMIPRGQEAELMGLYILSGQIIAWMPPVLFTVLNEAGFDMTYSFASLDIFFVISIVFFLIIGSHKKIQFDAVSQYDLYHTQEGVGNGAREEALESVLEMNTIVAGHEVEQVQRRNSHTLPAIS